MACFYVKKNVVKAVGVSQKVERGCSSSTDGCSNYIYGPLGILKKYIRL